MFDRDCGISLSILALSRYDPGKNRKSVVTLYSLSRMRSGMGVCSNRSDRGNGESVYEEMGNQRNADMQEQRGRVEPETAHTDVCPFAGLATRGQKLRRMLHSLA